MAIGGVLSEGEDRLGGYCVLCNTERTRERSGSHGHQVSVSWLTNRSNNSVSMFELDSSLRSSTYYDELAECSLADGLPPSRHVVGALPRHILYFFPDIFSSMRHAP